MYCVSINTFFIVFSDKNENIIGRLVFNNTNNIIEIIRLYVAKDYRNKGLATELLNLLFKNYPNGNFKLVANPDEDKDRSKLLKFYSKFGFKFDQELDEGTAMFKID